MVASSIVDYDAENKTIHYYEDYRIKERNDFEENVLDFMKKILIRMSEAQFKMIRYHVLYATYNHKHKGSVERILSKKLKSYRQ